MQPKRITLPCKACGTPFTTIPSQIKMGRGKFCGRACYVADLKARRSPEERFWASVDRSGGEDACWPYGLHWGRHKQFSLDGRRVSAHGYAFRLHGGIVPDGLWVLHKCDNPPCVNPRHLYAGTPADNSRDRDTRGRANTPRGERNGARRHPDRVLRGEDKIQAKLDWAKVREIRRRAAAGEMLARLSVEFSIDPSAVSRIVAGKSWPLRGDERPW